MDDNASTGPSGEASAAPCESNCSQRIEFTFVRFSERRRDRGVPAVLMVGSDDGGESGLLLWMSKQHILNNIRDFGDSDDLQRALRCYE